MSVNVQFDTTEVQVEEKITENTFTVNGSLAVFQGVEIEPIANVIDSSGAPLEVVYDFTVSTSGAAGPEVVEVSARGLVVGPGLTTAQNIDDFFTSIAVGGQLHAIPRNNKNGQIHYDLFYTNTATGLIDAELKYQQLVVPPGTLPAPIATGAAVISTVSVFREFRGINKVYDVFVVEGV